MLDFMKATWDHLPPLPKKPRLPPSLMNLRARRAWLSLKPQFEYGDERDHIQRKASIKAKRELARDEAWAKAFEKRQKKMDKMKAKQDKGFKILGDSKKTNKPSKPTRAATVPAAAAIKPKPTRAATVPAPGVQPKVVQGWSALQQPSARPMVHRSPSAPKVIYPTPVRSQPRSKPGMPQVAHRAHVPMRSASHPVPRKVAVAVAAPKVTVARAQTLPTAPKKR